jgi:hypothetical protein
VEEKPNKILAQPFTFEGIAGLATCSFGRWLLWMASVAVLSAGVVLFFLESEWAPVISETIILLPEHGAVRDQQLDWGGHAPVRVTRAKFLSIVVDPDETLQPGDAADLQVELGRTEVRFRSLFGYLPLPYPKGVIVPVNRTELEPRWGAWRPALAVLVGTGTVIWLFCVWSVLALIYVWPARLLAFYADRQVSLFGAWRLAAASLLPGALFFNLAILGYAFHHLNLVQLIFSALLHILIGWIYVLFAPFCLPRVQLPVRQLKRARNPFSGAKPGNRNPFATRDSADE